MFDFAVIVSDGPVKGIVFDILPGTQLACPLVGGQLPRRVGWLSACIRADRKLFKALSRTGISAW